MTTKMTTADVIGAIESNGGLDIAYIRKAAQKVKMTTEQYIARYIKDGYNVSDYVANNAAKILNR